VAPEQKVPELINFFTIILTAFGIDRQSRKDGFVGLSKKMTEEQIAQVKESLEKLDRVWNYLMDINSIMMRNMPDLTATAIEKEFLPLYTSKIAQHAEREDYEVIDAVCLLDDCMEFGPQFLFDKISGECLSKFTEVLYARGA